MGRYLFLYSGDRVEREISLDHADALWIQPGETIRIGGDLPTPLVTATGRDATLVWPNGDTLILLDFAYLIQQPNPPMLILEQSEDSSSRVIGDISSLLSEVSASAGVFEGNPNQAPPLDNTRHAQSFDDSDTGIRRQNIDKGSESVPTDDPPLGATIERNFPPFDLPSSRTTDIPTTAAPPDNPPITHDDTTINGQVFVASPLTIESDDLLANDTDADGDPLTISGIVAATHGVAVVDLGGDIVFRPDPGYSGDASITYTVSDGRGGNTTATLNLAITSVTQIDLADIVPEGHSPILGLAGIRFIGHTDTSGGYNDGVGMNARAVGDINGDGIDDFVIDASNADYSGADAGSIYVAFGGQDWESLDRADGSADGRIDINRIHQDIAGYRIDGENIYDGFGINIASVDDITGDGRRDLLVSAFGPNLEGLVYIIPGRVDFAALDADHNGILSASAFSHFAGARGYNPVTGSFDLAGVYYGTNPVAGAGDANGDGHNDLLIGAAYGSFTAPGYGSGGVYLIYGGHSFSGTVSLADIGASLDGVRFTGEHGGRTSGIPDVVGDRAGSSVTGLGDIDQDGYDDFLIGAYFNDSTPGDINRGAAYLVFGGQNFTAIADANHDIALSTIGTGFRGYKFIGEGPRDVAGVTVSLLGDINGDGYQDFAIGTFDTNNGAPTSGGAVVIYGGQSVNFARADAADGHVDGHISLGEVGRTLSGVRIDGEAESDEAGFGLSGAGDVNGDGYADFLIGARGNDGASAVNVGSAYLIFGSADLSHIINLRDVISGAVPGFKLSGLVRGDNTGISVSSAGDINHDGYSDLLIGAPGSPLSSPKAGSAQVIFGGDFWSGAAAHSLGLAVHEDHPAP